MPKRTRSLSTLLAFLSVGAMAAAADHATSVYGVVRDPRGVPQMGVLVELLHGSVVGTAFTDLEGRYHIAQVTPGVYDLRTSATLFLPTLHRSLLLRDGAPSTFNLTLTGLFDQTSWLPLPHRVGKGNVEDWKWTLRSPANRPILRVLEEDAEEQGSTAPETSSRTAPGLHGTLTTAGYSGGFGAGTSRIGLELGRKSSDHHSSDAVLLSAGVGDGGKAGNSGAAAVSMVAARETGMGQGVQRWMLVGFQSVPQLRSGSSDGLTVLELDSAERMELGSLAAIEVGGQTQVLRSGETLVVVHPFVQVSAHADDVWLVRYQYATAPGGTGFESQEADRAMMRVPTLVQGSAGLHTEAGSHQECTVSRSLGRARVEVSGFRDAERRTVLTGQMSHGNPHASPQQLAETVVDESNGSFRRLMPGFSGNGVRIGLQVPFGERGQITAAYVNGLGMGKRLGAGPSSVTVMPRRASAVYVAVKQDIAKTGTQVAVSYRWQPGSMLTKVGRYELSEVDPYLGLHIAQPVGSGRTSNWHAELVFDASNPFAEGYRSPPEPTQDAQYVSALRDMRAGLAVSF